jgi:Ran GTPase-activating protein (RanGAP) involved in mRNA processing and transport
MQLLLTEGSIFGKPRHPDSSNAQTDTPPKKSSHRPGKYDPNKKHHSQNNTQDDDKTKKFPLGRLARESSDTFSMIMRQTPSQNQWLSKESSHIRKSMSDTTPINFVASRNSMKNQPRKIRRDTMLYDLERQTKYKIVSIEISDFPIDFNTFGNGTPRLAEILKKCKDLENLTIQNSSVYDWNLIGNALESCDKIKRVNFSHDTYKQSSDKYIDTYKGLFKGLSHSPSLTEIDFSFCNLGNLSTILASTLPKFTELTKLNLNGIGYQIARYVVPALPQCPRLQHLELSDNDFAQASLLHLTSGLPKCTSLTHLDLSSNLFDFRDSMQLGYILSSCTTLRVLSLKNSSFFTAKVLCGLQSHSGFKRLIYLDVSNCNFNFTVNIRSSEIEEIIQKLSKCSSLTHLNLSYNPLQDVFARDHLMQILPTCTALTHLDLSHTGINEDTVHTLQQAWNTTDTHRPAEGLCIDQ